MHEVLFNRLGGLSLPRKSVVRLTDRPDMTLDVYRGRVPSSYADSFLQMILLLEPSQLIEFFPNLQRYIYYTRHILGLVLVTLIHF